MRTNDCAYEGGSAQDQAGCPSQHHCVMRQGSKPGRAETPQGGSVHESPARGHARAGAPSATPSAVIIIGTEYDLNCRVRVVQPLCVQRMPMTKRWYYMERADGRIAVTLDNNVWNFLFQRRMDLAATLPRDRFVLFITREVEIEAIAIPASASTKPLTDYIKATIEACAIRTTSVFGFAMPGDLPQRVGGFGQGTWQSQTEREFYEAIRTRFLLGKRETGSRLTQNEGDAAVAAQSFSPSP